MKLATEIVALQDAKDSDLVGGKAAGLGTLIRAGFRVPNGLVITPQAEQLHQKTFENIVLQAFDSLNVPFVAVRSSASAEDGQSVSWAGQFDTILNVSRDEVARSVRQCFSSLRQSQAGNMAIIIQEMVQSEISGVAFSMDPVSRTRDTVVIEAGFGLGEAIVSGEVTPDNYVVDKFSEQIISKRIARQEKQLVCGEYGQNIWQKLSINNDIQKLHDSQIQGLSRIVVELEKLCGYAVDIEWAWAKQSFELLQCRPVTGLS